MVFSALVFLIEIRVKKNFNQLLEQLFFEKFVYGFGFLKLKLTGNTRETTK